MSSRRQKNRRGCYPIRQLQIDTLANMGIQVIWASLRITEITAVGWDHQCSVPAFCSWRARNIYISPFPCIETLHIHNVQMPSVFLPNPDYTSSIHPLREKGEEYLYFFLLNGFSGDYCTLLYREYNFKLFLPESPIIPMKVGQFFILLSLNL